ncbi:speedy protein 1-B-like [Xenopus laevis]|uniref:Speedy protein 1-B-like n=1 Tax=Xenopus laevis TaxID=8355 RepID=A0A8J1KNK6_XENLA|nr:speedy protein 1-B-like [Xenopus laevis]XP_041418905.1 speedy protein 1-B-like [Xenopus laevis]
MYMSQMFGKLSLLFLAISRPARASPSNEKFYQLLEDNWIRRALEMDSCFKLSDKYLLAMVRIYFQRAGLQEQDYTTINFFAALLLANEMEDETDFWRLIYTWALGKTWREQSAMFRSLRNELWSRMNFQAWVSRESCEEAMTDNPTHWAWRRERQPHHGLAWKWHREPLDYFYFKVPDSPSVCSLCQQRAAVSQEAEQPKMPLKIRMKKAWKKE